MLREASKLLRQSLHATVDPTALSFRPESVQAERSRDLADVKAVYGPRSTLSSSHEGPTPIEEVVAAAAPPPPSKQSQDTVGLNSSGKESASPEISPKREHSAKYGSASSRAPGSPIAKKDDKKLIGKQLQVSQLSSPKRAQSTPLSASTARAPLSLRKTAKDDSSLYISDKSRENRGSARVLAARGTVFRSSSDATSFSALLDVCRTYPRKDLQGTAEAILGSSADFRVEQAEQSTQFEVLTDRGGDVFRVRTLRSRRCSFSFGPHYVLATGVRSSTTWLAKSSWRGYPFADRALMLGEIRQYDANLSEQQLDLATQYLPGKMSKKLESLHVHSPSGNDVFRHAPVDKKSSKRKVVVRKAETLGPNVTEDMKVEFLPKVSPSAPVSSESSSSSSSAPSSPSMPISRATVPIQEKKVKEKKVLEERADRRMIETAFRLCKHPNRDAITAFDLGQSLKKSGVVSDLESSRRLFDIVSSLDSDATGFLEYNEFYLFCHYLSKPQVRKLTILSCPGYLLIGSAWHPIVVDLDMYDMLLSIYTDPAHFKLTPVERAKIERRDEDEELLMESEKAQKAPAVPNHDSNADNYDLALEDESIQEGARRAVQHNMLTVHEHKQELAQDIKLANQVDPLAELPVVHEIDDQTHASKTRHMVSDDREEVLSDDENAKRVEIVFGEITVTESEYLEVIHGESSKLPATHVQHGELDGKVVEKSNESPSPSEGGTTAHHLDSGDSKHKKHKDKQEKKEVKEVKKSEKKAEKQSKKDAKKEGKSLGASSLLHHLNILPRPHLPNPLHYKRQDSTASPSAAAPSKPSADSSSSTHGVTFDTKPESYQSTGAHNGANANKLKRYRIWDIKYADRLDRDEIEHRIVFTLEMPPGSADIEMSMVVGDADVADFGDGLCYLLSCWRYETDNHEHVDDRLLGQLARTAVHSFFF